MLCAQNHGKDFKRSPSELYRRGWIDAVTGVSGGLRRGGMGTVWRPEEGGHRLDTMSGGVQSVDGKIYNWEEGSQ